MGQIAYISLLNHDKRCKKVHKTGGQNESDTQGWSRDYCFIVDEEFFIMDASYEQG